MNDRQRVEASIIPQLIFCVCKPMEDLQETEEHIANHKEITDASFFAMAEPTLDLPLQRAGQIHRRVLRLYNKVSDVLEGASNAQAMMAIYYLLEGLIQEERLSIYDDSGFGKAMGTYMQSIDHYWEEEKLDQAAQKKARRMREVLRSEGYFT